MRRRFKKRNLFWLKVGVGGIGVLLISVLFGHLLGSYMTKAFSPRRSTIKVKGSLKKSPPLPSPTPLTKLESPTGQKTEDRGRKSRSQGVKESRSQEDRRQEQDVRGQKIPSIYRVQAGVFVQRDNAERLIEKLKAEGYSPYLSSIEKEGALWYRVQVGAFKGRLNAEELTNDLEKRGYSACIVEE